MTTDARGIRATVEKFPRSHKFTLGDRVESIALGVLESLIEATYTRDRAEALRRGNLGIEKLRFLIRLAADLRLPDRRRYEHAARMLDDTGWMKAHRVANNETAVISDGATEDAYPSPAKRGRGTAPTGRREAPHDNRLRAVVGAGGPSLGASPSTMLRRVPFAASQVLRHSCKSLLCQASAAVGPPFSAKRGRWREAPDGVWKAEIRR